jgi:hypothetical protein
MKSDSRERTAASTCLSDIILENLDFKHVPFQILQKIYFVRTRFRVSVCVCVCVCVCV